MEQYCGETLVKIWSDNHIKVAYDHLHNKKVFIKLFNKQVVVLGFSQTADQCCIMVNLANFKVKSETAVSVVESFDYVQI